MDSESHSLGTGVYDEDEHGLINNEPTEMQRQNTSSPTRSLLFFIGAIVLIAIVINYAIAPKPTSNQQKAELKDKIFDPIAEINQNALNG